MSQGHQDTSTPHPTNTAVIGAGSIGAAFAIVFANAGCRVAVFDLELTALEGARASIARSLSELASFDLLSASPGVIAERIDYSQDLALAVSDAQWIHECVPEKTQIKAAVFRDLDALAPADAILASASSAIPASAFAADLSGRGRCLIAHPGNPPFLLRVLELVPAPFTTAATLERAQQFARQVALDPIVVRSEIEGFVFNRLQGALLREAYCLVRDGVASVEDIDTLVRKGLGLRWSVIGPFETADLNTRGGIASHAEKLGPAYARMGLERGQNDPWTDELVATVTEQRRQLLPLEDWSERVAWRDRMLMQRLTGSAVIKAD